MKNWGAIIFILTVIVSCTELIEDDFPDLPSFGEGSVIMGPIDQFKCTVSGSVLQFGDGVIEVGHVWSLGNANPTIENSDGVTSNKVSLSSDSIQSYIFVDTLRLANPEFEYFVSAYAKDFHDRTVYSPSVRFFKKHTFNKSYGQQSTLQIFTKGESILSLEDGTFIVGAAMDRTSGHGEFLIKKIGRTGDQLPYNSPSFTNNDLRNTTPQHLPLELSHSEFGFFVHVPGGSNNGICDNTAEIWQFDPINGDVIRNFLNGQSGNSAIRCRLVPLNSNIADFKFVCSECVDPERKLNLRYWSFSTIGGGLVYNPNRLFDRDFHQIIDFVYTNFSNNTKIYFGREFRDQYVQFDPPSTRFNPRFFIFKNEIDYDVLGQYQNVELLHVQKSVLDPTRISVVFYDKTDVILLNINENGAVNEKFSFTIPDNTIFTDAIYSVGGNIVLIGVKCKPGYFCFLPQFEDNYEYSFLLELDPNGTQVFERTFSSSTFGKFYSIDNTIDGGYVMTGINNSLLSVVKTSDLGEVFEKCPCSN